MTEQDGRFTLYTLVPTDVTVRTLLIIVFWGGLGIFLLVYPTPNPEGVRQFWKVYFFGIAFFATITASQIYDRRLYRWSYDADTIYFRPDGLTWKLKPRPEWVIRYDEVAEMIAVRGRMNLKPFEYIHIARAEPHGDERYFLSRIYLRENELKTFLRFAYTKIPQKFPADIIDYMNAEPGWVERKQIEAAG